MNGGMSAGWNHSLISRSASAALAEAWIRFSIRWPISLPCCVLDRDDRAQRADAARFLLPRFVRIGRPDQVADFLHGARPLIHQRDHPPLPGFVRILEFPHDEIDQPGEEYLPAVFGVMLVGQHPADVHDLGAGEPQPGVEFR